MHLNRRDFLKKGVAAVGAAAAGAAAVKALEAASPPACPVNTSAAATTPALSADGHVMHVHTDHDGNHVMMHAPAQAVSNEQARQGVPGRRWVMVLDLARCDGCGHCTQACAKMHFLPPTRQWIPVLVQHDAQSTAPYWFPRPCFHCDIPPCTKVCPVDATFKTADGTVLVDNDRCIGCRFCIAACPYGVRCFNWAPPQDPPEAAQQPYSPRWGFPRRIGTVEKCDFCPDMAAAGMLPACASGCPMGVIYFGDQNEDAVTNSFNETVRLSKFLRDRAAYRHLEELGTRPRVYYLPPVNRQYPAPGEEKPKKA